MSSSSYHRTVTNFYVPEGPVPSDEALSEHRKSLTVDKELTILEVNLLAQRQLQDCLRQMRYQETRTGKEHPAYLELVEQKRRLKAIIFETQQLLASMREGLKFNDFMVCSKAK